MDSDGVLGLALWVFAPPLVAWSVVHTLRFRKVFADYLALRKLAGAMDRPGARIVEFGLNPAIVVAVALVLVIAGAAMLGVRVFYPPDGGPDGAALASGALAVLGEGLAEGLAALVLGGLMLLFAVRLLRSPWHPVLSRLRRAIYASESGRIALLSEALEFDPEVGVPERR